jgi:hypothetical protein
MVVAVVVVATQQTVLVLVAQVVAELAAVNLKQVLRLRLILVVEVVAEDISAIPFLAVMLAVLVFVLSLMQTQHSEVLAETTSLLTHLLT